MTKNTDKKMGLIFNDVARFRTTLFDQLMQKHGLTHMQAFALNRLFKKDNLTQTELAALLGVGTVTTSGLIDRMEANGWIERRPDSKDRRIKRIALTDKAWEIRKEMAASYDCLNEITTAGMRPEEIDLLISLMKRAKQNLSDELDARLRDKSSTH